jgi:uncharacterized protein (TIGR02246 family)
MAYGLDASFRGLTRGAFGHSFVTMRFRLPTSAPLLFAIVTSVLACTPDKNVPKPFAPDRNAEAALLVADRNFARDTADKGVDGWVENFAEDGAQIVTGKPLVVGRTAIKELMKPLLANSSSRLRWEPERAAVSASGDLGYTFGHAEWVTVTPGSETVAAKLQYLTVWKRQIDGSWRVAMDVGSPEP